MRHGTTRRRRRWTRLALLCTALLATPAAAARAQVTATTTKTAPPHDATSRALLSLEDQWAAAVVKRDGATFERLLAPGFVYTENDQLMDRAAVLASITAGSDTVTAARNEGMQVHRYGSTTAVVTGWLVMDGRGASGPFSHRYRFTDTWVKRDGTWRIVAAQDYLMPAAGAR